MYEVTSFESCHQVKQKTKHEQFVWDQSAFVTAHVRIINLLGVIESLLVSIVVYSRLA